MKKQQLMLGLLLNGSKCRHIDVWLFKGDRCTSSCNIVNSLSHAINCHPIIHRCVT